MEYLEFSPFPLFPTAHQQTILSAFLQPVDSLSYQTQFVTLKDQDQMSLEMSVPINVEQGNRDKKLIVVMVHGLGGSAHSPYVIRMAKKLAAFPIEVVRVNLRGAGSAKGKAKYPYHGGMTNDLLQALKMIKEKDSETPLVLVGFSLGGNLVLKLAGELQDKARSFFDEVIAIHTPADLIGCVHKLHREENQVFEKYFVKLLINNAYFRHKHFYDLPDIALQDIVSFMEFDEAYTAPMFGFSSAWEYYEKTSAKEWIGSIKVPCKILFSQDDPVIDCQYVCQNAANYPENIKIFLTEKGGHMGYLGSIREERGFFWLDHLLLEWIMQDFPWKG